ncbi:uncharacterized protein [Triticum aestivum]|uniref:uncharacterized protein n=1 Tax=Triticum aestivum TaxID=4565 RepID=UPI001D021F90|nr:uncharacterized protein LOC123047024 [Triticum aestivum]
MDEGNSNITKLLESLLAKMDEQKATHDKQIEVQAAFNAQISQDVRGLARQIDLTQADVDATRKTVEGSASPSGSVTTLLHQPAAQQQPPPLPPPPPHSPRLAAEPGRSATAHARLGDHRPPLIPVAPQGGFVAPAAIPSPTSGYHDNDYHKPPKHDFPRFDGDAPYLWLDRCLAYFELYKVEQHKWVTTAALYIEGQAAHWLQAFRQTRHGLTWDSFTAAVLEEFGADEFEMVMHKLLQLRQTATVAEYRAAFDEQMYHLLALDPNINTKFFVTQFILGLKDELHAPVRLQAPTSIIRASMLARIQEEELGTTRARPRITPAGRPPPATMQTQPRANAPNRAPTDDYARERQIRDFRRANNLCFKCGDRYSREHRCAQPAQLLMISIGEHGEVLSDDTIHALQLLDDPGPAAPPPAPARDAPECCLLSSHALDGTELATTIRLRALVGNQVMLLLLDSGSSHSFVNKSFVDRLELKTEEMPQVDVRVANGDRLTCNHIVPELRWWMQGHTFATPMRELDIGAYDGILGMDLLAQHSPMTCHWQDKWVKFSHDGEEVTLRGAPTKTPTTIKAIKPDELCKMIAGNDVWAMAMVDSCGRAPPPRRKCASQTPLADLLEEFVDVFAAPKGPPPHRQYDHALTLVEGAIPANTRPYRYSPLQKDEIERQVKEMLNAGIITHSVSPYAAPVLLVKKKDGTWRFRVDYRRLNDATIKNKFPLPIVDELFDELAGAAVFSKLDLRAGYHQIRMREEDETKTAFKTHHGHFQFRVMPFGLTNAPATFQCLMNAIFSKYVRKFVIIFLDDILVFSEMMEEHIEHLRIVFELLRAHQLFVKESKCSFACDHIDYLGHVISKEGMATDKDKTQAMEQWPTPTNATELRGFLGLTGYYRKFVPHYGIIAKPLTQLLTKKGFAWSEQAQAAFDRLKIAMTTTPVLALPDFDKPFSIETDACDTGVGAVLVQEGHPVAFFSKALDVRNQKLSTYEKEFLAVMMAIDKWRPTCSVAPSTSSLTTSRSATWGSNTSRPSCNARPWRNLSGCSSAFSTSVDSTMARPTPCLAWASNSTWPRFRRASRLGFLLHRPGRPGSTAKTRHHQPRRRRL